MIHLKRYLASLAVVLTMWGTYALAVAPWLIPAAIVKSPDAAPPMAASPSDPTALDLAQLFPPDAWERDNPKIVETEACTLLVKDYQTTADGKLELNPCTLIFYAQAADGKGPRRPIVLQAPQGAVVQFDKALNVAKAEFGKLVGGRLPGDITIFSPATSPAANDALRLTTRNIQIDKNRVFTPHEVDFTYGDSRGRGRDLTIALLPKDAEDPTGGSGIGGVRSIALAKIDFLHLAMEGMGVLPTPGAARGPLAPRANAPIEVRCQGPFVFDVLSETAMFDEGVEVERVNPDGPPDKLTCRQLLLMFAEDGPAGAATSAKRPPAASTSAADPLAGRLQRIVAKGSPVTLVAPSSATVASAATIEYSLSRRRLLLAPGPQVAQVALRQEQNDFTARELEYELAEPGRLGRLWAAGPGQLKLVQAAGPLKQTVVARWEKELRVRPHERNHVISLIDKASITAEPLGQFSAEELHLWVLEVPAVRAGEQPGQPLEQPGSKQPTRFTLLPDRLLASGGVRLDAPQLHVDTARLEVWFQNHPPKPRSLPPVTPAAHLQPVELAPARPGEQPLRPPSLQKFDLTGDLIQMQVVRQGSEMDLEDLMIRGHVVLDETRTNEPGQPPIRIRGDRLELRGGVTGPGKVDISGQPAEVGGRGMSLAGSEIHLVRSENRLWIDGPGEAKLPSAVNVGLPGSEASPPPMPAGAPAAPPDQVRVVWKDRFHFDGQAAEMLGEVQATTATQTATGKRLLAALNRRIDFAVPGGREQTDLARLELDGGVSVVSRGLDQHGEQASFEQMQVKNIVIDRTAGSLHAQGPGWVSSTRLATAGVPGAPGSSTPPPPADPAAPPKLNYIRVDFEGAIAGDLNARLIEFQQQVRTTFGPVTDWKGQVIAERLEDLGEQGALMTSERLTIVEMTPAGQPRWIEAAATGNTVVEGKTFTVHAPKVAFTSDKQLLTLEGDGRAEAELWYRTVPGQPTSYSAARKWRYWLDSQTFDVEGIKVFDFNLLGTGRFRLPGQK